MSDNISVAVRDVMGARVPSLSQIDVVVGQSVTFKAVDAVSSLYFSPDLIGILVPTPGDSASLAPEHDLTYRFSSADPGAYEIYFQSPEMAAPQTFDPPAADHNSFLLTLKSGSGGDFGVTTNPIQTVQAHGVPLGVTTNSIQTFAAVQPHGIMGSVEPENFNITTNPIQT